MSVDLEILLIEDNEDDVLLTQRAIREGQIRCRLEIARDGRTGLNHLQADAPNRSLPGLIFLDLNLPGMDGFEVLRQIRSADRLRCVPVVVLTTSRESTDVRRSYALGANSYIRKPVDYQEFVQALDTILNYWVNLNELPDRCL